ncbi:MAG: hypothetical protein DMG97_01780 [Acidobacteria bacterium]|nr:MAG: hypothetical protein DMG97_01780 [Acidobacteriota bacterium]
MTKRGKILRDASAGPGLVSVDGQHYQFALEGMWRSEVPPTAGMAVEIDFAADASIVGISQVSDAQIAKEQAEAVMKAARQKGVVLTNRQVRSAALDRNGADDHRLVAPQRGFSADAVRQTQFDLLAGAWLSER